MKDDKVHRQGSRRIHSIKCHIGWALLSTDGHLCPCVDTILPEDHCQRISYCIVAQDEFVFFAAQQMVPEGIQGITTHGAWGSGCPWRDLGSKPPP